MSCLRQGFALFLIFGGLIMGFFATIAGVVGQIIGATVTIIIGVLLLAWNPKK